MEIAKKIKEAKAKERQRSQEFQRVIRRDNMQHYNDIYKNIKDGNRCWGGGKSSKLSLNSKKFQPQIVCHRIGQIEADSKKTKQRWNKYTKILYNRNIQPKYLSR